MRRAVALVTGAGASRVSAVSKVVDMLKGMQAHGEGEIQQEKVRFRAYQQWCSDTKMVKDKAVSSAQAEIVQLKADIESADADVADLSRSIEAHAAAISKMTTEKKESVAQRKEQHAAFLLVKQDYEESIEATAAAIKILQAEAKTVDQAVPETALAQMSGKVRAMIAQNPKGYAYENSSGSIVELLGELEEKFEAELNQATEEEMKKKHAHTMIVENLDNLVANETKQKEMDEVLKGQRGSAAGAARTDLADTEASLAADEKYLADVVAECQLKGEEFTARQQLRADEISAIEQAVEILSKVPLEKETKHLVFLQVKRATRTTDKVRKVVSLLEEAGEQQQSRALKLLAVQMSTGGSFDKVIQMVRDLIFKLQQQSNEEATKNAYCSTAMAENKEIRSEKKTAVTTLTAEVEELQASIEKMTTRIADNTEAVKENKRLVKEATAARTAEHEKNVVTMEEAKEAGYAVSQALSVLAEFYQSAADATALLQQEPVGEKPATWTASYTGMQGMQTGVMGLLKVIQSDFVKLETDTKADEDQAAEEHSQFLDDSEKDTELKGTEIDHLTAKRTQATAELTAAEKDLDLNKEALAAAQETYQALFQECDVNAKSADQRYKERMAKRGTELQSLKEALEILSTPPAL